MPNPDNLLESTIDYLFRELGNDRLRYAILRNHETLPSLNHQDSPGDVTDIDLVIDSEDLPRWREIAKRAAAKFQWEFLTECDHWCQSACRSHHIEVFRFYRLAPLAFIQVDVFHAQIIWGVPVLNEGDLLANRRANARGIMCVDPVKERFQMLMKMPSLVHSRSKQTKKERYVKKIMSFWSANRDAFELYLQTVLSRSGVRTLHALQQNNLHWFAFHLTCARAFAFTRFTLVHPADAMQHVIARAVENRKRFVTRPCGRLVRVWAPDAVRRQLATGVLYELRKNNVFDNWSERLDKSPLSSKHRSIMEQGGLVIEWSDAETAHLKIAANSDAQDLTKAFLTLLISQDKVLCGSSASVGTAPALVRSC